MVTLSFWGYGGENAIGKLSEKELDGIKKALDRFGFDIFSDNWEISFDPEDSKRQFYEWDSVYMGYGVSSGRFSAEDENGEQIGEYDFGDPKPEYRNIIKFAEEGYYFCGCSSEKGSFCEVHLDIDSKDFDPHKVELFYDDLSETWSNDTVLSGVKYDGIDQELDFDCCSTNGKGFYQNIVYVDDELNVDLDGLDVLWGEDWEYRNTITHTIFQDVDEDDVNKADLITDYIRVSNGSLGEIETPIAYHIPALYKSIGKDKADDLLFDKDLFQQTKNHNLVAEYPKYLLDKIETEKPEWLI